MTVYVRHTTKPIKYRPWLRPWYRWLDWWQGGNVPGRFWTSRTGRVLIWLVPKLIVGLFRLACIFVTAVFTIGIAVLLLTLSLLGGGNNALFKASKSANR